MQRHAEHKFRNAFSIGLIALLLVLLVSTMGHDINAMAIYNEEGDVLSAENGIGIGLMVVVSFISVLFVLSAMDFMIAENKFNEKDEKKLRAFAAMCRGRGYSRDEITNLLAKHGWKETEIKNYLN